MQVSNGSKAEKALRKRSKAEKAKVLKISGDKLLKKGLVITDEETNMKECVVPYTLLSCQQQNRYDRSRMSRVTLEISPVVEQKGIFEVWIRRPKQDVVVAHVDFQVALSRMLMPNKEC